MMQALKLLLPSTAICFAFLVGCINSDNDPLKWTEDVLLPDGRVLTLTRYQEFKGPHELGEKPSVSDYWLEFKHPDTGAKIRWQSNRDLTALALFFYQENAYLLVNPNFGGYNRYGCPNPPYLLFSYQQNEWKKVPLVEIPIKKIRVNLTHDPQSKRDVIKRSKDRHLDKSETSNSTYMTWPYFINFNLMKEQTFSNKNCGRLPTKLIEKS